MRILVTGANGFIGRNLIAELRNQGHSYIVEFDINSDIGQLDALTKDCEFIFHLAGVNRPQNSDEFMEGNVGLTSSLLSSLKRNDNRSPVMLSSSIQAVLDNPYGMSKRACEDILFAYAKETGAKVLVYRFPNIFGKWCRPNYNSVIATFCHNLANGLPIQINNPNIELNLVYIDDVIAELIQALSGMENRSGDLCLIPIVYKARLGAVAELIQSFIDCRNNLSVPDLGDSFTKKLYSTYLSYLPEDRFKYPLNMHIDERGSFTEFIRTPERGQFSINISRPGIVKGQHWHHTKNEKFLVVCGKGLVRFRKINSDIVLEYHVSGDNLEVIDIPVGYTHSIINIGDCNLVALVWANEPFDPEHPDTYPLNV